MNNEIQYTLNNTTIIDRFRSEDKAELLLSLYLLDRTLSGDHLNKLLLISRELKPCIRYLIEQKIYNNKNPFYEDMINTLTQFLCILEMENILNLEYLNSNECEEFIKEKYEKVKGGKIKFSRSEDWLISYPIILKDGMIRF